MKTELGNRILLRYETGKKPLRMTEVQALLRFDHHEQLRSRETGISFSLFPHAFYLCCPCATFTFLSVNLALHHNVHYEVSQTTLYIFIIICPDQVFVPYLLLAH